MILDTVQASDFVKSIELSVDENKKKASIACNLGNFKDNQILGSSNYKAQRLLSRKHR